MIQQLVRQKDAEENKLEKEKNFLSMGYEAPSLSMPEPVQVDNEGLAFIFQISRYVSDQCNYCSWCNLAPASFNSYMHTCSVCCPTATCRSSYVCILINNVNNARIILRIIGSKKNNGTNFGE